MHVLKMVAAALSLLAVNGITCAALASPSIEQCLEQADLPGCFIAVKGNDAWRTARFAWLEQHEQRLAEQDEGSQRGGSVCTVPELPRPISPRKTVGNGTPASCTESRLRRALSGGGTIAFSCGSSPVIIPPAAYS